MAKSVKKTALKKRKKLWYRIIAPKLFNEMVLGETLVAETGLMINKILKINLMVITNDMKKQNTIIHFRINEVRGDTAVTEITGYEIMPAAIKRLIRRDRERIDKSIILHTKDGKKLRLKYMLITRNVTNRSVKTTLSKNAAEYLASYVEKLYFDQLISNLISYKLQLGIKNALKKIYPLRTAEVRMLLVVGSGKPQNVEKKVDDKKEAVKEEEKKEETKKEEVKEDKKEKNPAKEENKEEKTEDKKEEKPAEKKTEEAEKKEAVKEEEKKEETKKEEVKEDKKEETKEN